MSRNQKIIFSFIILFIGILVTFSEYFNSKKIEVYDYVNELYYKETVELEEVTEEIMNNEEEVVEDTKTYELKEEKVNYIGYLSIPKIDLKKGFTSKEDKNNTVSKNIEILSSSDYPDKELGNVIIASHSGNSSISFFKKLYLLQVDDLAYIEYNNRIYTYKISNIYTVEKTGSVEVIRNKDVSTLTLITCTKGDNTTQTVYIADLISVE